MKANPDKLYAICIGRNTHDAISPFQLSDNVTLLGVKFILGLISMIISLTFAKKHLNSWKCLNALADS